MMETMYLSGGPFHGYTVGMQSLPKEVSIPAVAPLGEVPFEDVKPIRTIEHKAVYTRRDTFETQDSAVYDFSYWD